MTTKVYTETCCERCGMKDIREGAHAETLQCGWALFKLTWTSKWTSGTPPMSLALCGQCASDVAVFVERPPSPIDRAAARLGLGRGTDA